MLFGCTTCSASACPMSNCFLAERGVVGSYETVRSVMQDIRPELCPTNCVTASHGLEAALVGLGDTGTGRPTLDHAMQRSPP